MQSFRDPAHFINRELSWLEFNARVLEEAEDPSTPLLERAKFLAIFSSNLDEFFMVRVAGLREQGFGDGAPQDYNPDRLEPISQLQRIATRTQELVARQYRCLNEMLLPELAAEGIRLQPFSGGKKQKELDRFFQERVFPIITPMAIDPAHPSPRFHNRGLYLAAILHRHSGLGPQELFAVVQLPQVLPRLVPVGHKRQQRFVLLEDVIATRLPDLFGGFDVKTWSTFRITRDGDLDVLEQESDDMLRAIEQRLRARRRADAVRLEVAHDADDEVVGRLVREEYLHDGTSGKPDEYDEIYRLPGPLDLTFLWSLVKLPGFDRLRDRPFRPQQPQGLGRRGDELFHSIAQRDVLLHHPFDSFAPVVEFVRSAAEDPQVAAIKQTLYRTSGDSPITAALIQAAENGKHVTALVELKARFDEEANVNWARQMEQAGVHVVYGFMDLKTHCKVSLVVRQEGKHLRRYVHLGTGNYNPATALSYTDLGLFTVDEQIADDVSALFNLLTGYSQGHEWHKLIVAPGDMQRRVIALIDKQTRRARRGKPSRIFAKLNSLVDTDVIEALFRASRAGVPIHLLVRGICCLRPGIPEVSENIRVTSIVDRFLEHSRIMVFGADDEAKIFLSSADWMPRNFHRRVEVMFPIESPELKQRILQEIVPTYLQDNTRARLLESSGRYERIVPDEGKPAYRAQIETLKAHLRRTLGRRGGSPETIEELEALVASGNGRSQR